MVNVQRTLIRAIAGVLLGCCIAPPLVAQPSGRLPDAITVTAPTVFPQDAELADRLQRNASTAIDTVSAQRGLRGAGARAARIELTLLQEAEGSTFVVTLTGPDGRETTLAETLTAGQEPGALGPTVAYLFDQLYPPVDRQQPPRFVDEFPIRGLNASLFGDSGIQLFAFSVAPHPAGGVVLGGITGAVHLDERFTLVSVPTHSLIDRGNYTSATAVATTPAGTLYTRPATGSDLFRFQPGRATERRLRVPLSGFGPIAALADGSAVIVDTAAQRAVRISDEGTNELAIHDLQYSFIQAIAAGPDGNLWVVDGGSRRIVVYAPDGRELRRMLPSIEQAELAAAKSLAVTAEGDALILTQNALHRIDARGTRVWSLQNLEDELRTNVGQMNAVAWNQATGSIYLADYQGGRVIRLLEASRRADRFTEQILQLNTRAAAAGTRTDRTTLLAQRARLYEEHGALEMAASVWDAVLLADPSDDRAGRELERIEVALLERGAARDDARTRQLLADFGRETARATYRATLRQYERILFLDPGNEAVRGRKAALEQAFEGGALRSRPTPFAIAQVELEPLFPVLMERYRNGGVGTITIESRDQAAISEIEVLAEVSGFSEVAARSAAVTRLQPGGRAEIELHLALGSSVLELSEDLPVSVTVTVSGVGSDGVRYSVRQAADTTLHRRSALVWDDSAKLASFVTPNEDLVAAFALRSLAAQQRRSDHQQLLSRVVDRAAVLADALAEHGIAYVEDPNSPFSRVQGDLALVDTVRFPRTTLYYSSGDCDDSSALLCSLYEAAGIRSAIVTTPGHVMIAFDTREPVSQRWFYETERTAVFEHGGTLWLPIETTALELGFTGAWIAASARIRRHRPSGAVEFLPLEQARTDYPPLALPRAVLTVPDPPADQVAARVRNSGAGATDVLLAAAVSRLESNLAGARPRRAAAVHNQIGIVYARFARETEAEQAFRTAIELHPDGVPARANLARLELSRGRPADTVALLQQTAAAQSNPDVIELLARAYTSLGEESQRSRYLGLLQQTAPDRAVALAGNTAEGARASLDDDGFALSTGWVIDD